MKERTITTVLREYAPTELPEKYRELVRLAREACHASYAPYSRFHVGAAIELEGGVTVCGSNQENAAYPSGTCAERTAAFYASASHPGVPMRRIAIAAWTRLHLPADTPSEECYQREPISPCGACRQALLEYEHAYGPIEVVLSGADRVYVLPSVESLLPLSFTSF